MPSCAESLKVLHGNGKSPGAHCFEDRPQLPAKLRELVLNPRRDLWVSGAGHDPVGLEAPKPAGESVGADAGQRVAQLSESMRAVEKLPHDKGGPRAIQEQQGTGDTTGGQIIGSSIDRAHCLTILH